MKIGIVTFHDANNYGAVLQAYALQRSLKKIAPLEDITIYDYKCNFVISCYKIWYFSWDKSKSLYKNIRHLFGNVYRVFQKLLFIKSIQRINEKFNIFRNKYLNVSSEDLDLYDKMIFGSDQIWSPYTSGDDLFYFGKGISCLKYSYGLSDGGNFLLNNEKSLLIKDFEYVSCREKKLESKIKKELNIVNTNIVCDPVFLLSKEEWGKFCNEPEENDYILIYKIAENDSLYEEAYKLSLKTGLKVIAIDYEKRNREKITTKYGIEFRYEISPVDFVGYIKKAKYVITTSFHGTAFSLIFRKDFFVLKFEVASDRIENLLEEFMLSSRYIKTIDEVNSLSINYSEVFCKNMNDYICSSKNYLSFITEERENDKI